MASVHDVASYILAKKGEMTAMKLQKLCYYAEAWSLVWDETSIFPERIEAWANGPVCCELFRSHRGCFRVSSLARGDADKLNLDERATVEAVLEHYGDMSPQYLSDLTHSEAPWKAARAGQPPGARSNAEITRESMQIYYSEL